MSSQTASLSHVKAGMVPWHTVSDVFADLYITEGQPAFSIACRYPTNTTSHSHGIHSQSPTWATQLSPVPEIDKQPGVVPHASNASSAKVEAGGLGIHSQLRLHTEFKASLGHRRLHCRRTKTVLKSEQAII